MCILAITEICHFVHIFKFVILLFFHRHNSLQQQSLGIKSSCCRLFKWISGHVCKLLLTLFSNNNSSNRAVFLFVQMPFDVTKQSGLGACTDGVKLKVNLLNDLAVYFLVCFFLHWQMPINTSSHTALCFKHISCPIFCYIALA